MKTGILQGSKWVAGLAGATLLLSLGCSLQRTDAQGEPAATAALASSPETASAPAPAAELSEPPSAPVIPADLSPGVAEIVKLAQAQVGEDVMLAYVSNQATNVHPTADEIVYLTDLGVSDKVIAVLAQRAAPVAAENAPVETAAENQPVEPAPVLETQPPAPPVEGAYPDAVAAEPTVAPPAPAAEAVVQVEPPQPVSNEYFYDSLAPYGAWVEVPDYGLCWQPTVVVTNPEWRPYCDRGHWIYTDCGWYWESDYTWGWAPFHYGRWVHHGRHGWVWRPDGVWGPSWVSWRQTDAYCGWAPLPPEARFEVGVGLTFRGGHVRSDFDFHLGASAFTFVSVNHFYDRRPDHFRVPPRQVPGVFRGSVPVNDIRHDRSRVFNGGISRERIAIANHRDIRPVAVRPIAVDHSPGRPVRMEHMERGGRTLDVYHPRVEANRPPTLAHEKAPVLINKGPQLPPPSRPSAFRPTPSSPAPSQVHVPDRPRTFDRGSDRQTQFAPNTRTEIPANRQNPGPTTLPGATQPAGTDHTLTRLPKRGEMPSSTTKFNSSGNSLPRPTHPIPATTPSRPAAATPAPAPALEFKNQNQPVPSAPTRSMPERNIRTQTPVNPSVPKAFTAPSANPSVPRSFTPPAANPSVPKAYTPPTAMPSVPAPSVAPRAYTPPPAAPAPRAFNPPAAPSYTPPAAQPAPRASAPSAPPAASQPAPAPRSAPSAPPSANTRAFEKDKNK